MKESFVIYKAFYEPISELSDEDLGLLFRSIFNYQINGIEPTNTSRIYMAFQFFKNQFRLDNDKYQKVVNRNKTNGLNGGRPKTQDNPNNPVGFQKPKKADNDNDNVITKVINIYGYDFSVYVSQWLKYKLERKEKYKTDESILLFCKKLNELSKGQLDSTKEIIETSIANNWAGVFELKPKPKLDDRNKTEKMIFY